MTHEPYSPKEFRPNRAVLDAILVKQAEKAKETANSEDPSVQRFAAKHQHVVHEIEDVIQRAFPPRSRTERRSVEAL